MTYDRQLAFKQASVVKQFAKYCRVAPIEGMENPYNYRNKLQYPVGLDNAGHSVMGVFAERTHSIIPTKECKIQDSLSQE